MKPQTGPGSSIEAGTTPSGFIQNSSPLVARPGEATLDGKVIKAATQSQSPQAASQSPATGSGDAIAAGSVQAQLDNLVGGLPPPPAQIGRYAPPWALMSGIPDWGSLKLQDPSGVKQNRYPTYAVAPGPAIDPLPFPQEGQDPQTDWVWNSGISAIDLPGTGIGQTRSSGVFAGGGPVVRTLRTVAKDLDAKTGNPLPYVTVALSGIVYPADRGVLALIHYPASSSVGKEASGADYIAQPLEERVVAALLLGQGIAPPPTPTGIPPKPQDCAGCGVGCDGSPGGIFDPGRDEEGSYDPLGYPGRASGQYDLSEILLGVDALDGLPLRAPFDDYNQDGRAGAQRLQGSTLPAAGQVRLGTDPNLSVPLPYGIPIFGASGSGYLPEPPAGPDGFVRLGSSVLRLPDGQEPNFYAYRLAQLTNYTHLPYTPRGMVEKCRETFRYFRTLKPHAVLMPDGTKVPDWLPSAGLYGGLFTQDAWGRQIARYRHVFTIPAPTDDLVRAGTYALLHFRTEGAFEDFVLKGQLEQDRLYGASWVDTRHLGGQANVANQLTKNARSPLGPAPQYGYAATSYHAVRAEVTIAAKSLTPKVAKGSADWVVVANPPVIYTSGVAYFTPLDDVGNPVIGIGAVDFTAEGAFSTGVFGVDDARLQNHTAPPALIAPPCPVVLTIADWTYGDLPTSPGQPTLQIPVGPAPLGLTNFTGSALEPRVGRVEIPLTHCGKNAKGDFSDLNAPEAVDKIEISCSTPMALWGDEKYPAFSSDARIRAYVRDRAQGTVWPKDGTELTLNPPACIMLHTERNATPGPHSGNYTTGTKAPYTVSGSLANPQRDKEERFLDEIYRYVDDWLIVGGLYGKEAQQALQGPGLGSWRAQPIAIPIRVAHTTGWETASWVRAGLHLNPLPNGQLQVAGLPHRVPSLLESPKSNHPSSGMVRYPAEDYQSARPSKSDDGLATDQPNYKGSTGVRSYVRAFDLVQPGRSIAKIKILGVDFDDLDAKNPNRSVLVQVKIPGQTTWLDVGLRDGAGPSKQSPTHDGAGCLIIGPHTTSGIDEDSGLATCTLQIHLGNFASGVASGFAQEVPLLVRITMNEAAVPYDLSRAKDPVMKTFGPPDITAPNRSVRGIVSITLI